MAKLYFRYGTMDSAKTLNLLAVAHNYRKQGKRVLLVKPRIDTRFGDIELEIGAYNTIITDHQQATAQAISDEGYDVQA